MRTRIEDGRVIVCLEGRVSSANASDISSKIDEIMAANPGSRLEIDAGELEYISSAGLRILLRLAKAQKGLTIKEVTPDVYGIMKMTGFTDLLDVRQKMREFCVEGCEVVGRGACGTVYRVDEDTVVKVYEIPDCLGMIENEQRRAKQAFLKGIPTAISYDVVKVGDKYGSVFELLRASTYNDLILSHPEDCDEIIVQYADFIRQIHSVEMERGELPEAGKVFAGYLDRLEGVLPDNIRSWVRGLLEVMPEDLHVVHGDIQMKNVMLSAEEPLLVDMDTLSVGDPVFDLTGLYVTYMMYKQDEPDNTMKFLGISSEMATHIWERFMECYFEGVDGDRRGIAEDRIRVLANIRFLYLVAVMNIGTPELVHRRVEHSCTDLEGLMAGVDSLEVRSLMSGAERSLRG